MSLFFSSLNSGSNGNCYYVGNGQDAVLIDAGISCREIEVRMKELGLSLQGVKGIFVSHEHTDHIRGIAVLAAKYKIGVYGTAATLRGCYLKRSGFPVHLLQSNEPVLIGSLEVLPFPKLHDAADPHSFVVSGGGVTVGVFTDLGIPCSALRHHFSRCDAAFLEANYDEDMLEKGRYPFYLKRRIRGGQGHLSNRQALEVFLSHRSPSLQHLVLAHLSKENNCPELVSELFGKHAGSTRVLVASRYAPSPVFEVKKVPRELSEITPPPAIATSRQMQLFN